MVEMAVVQLELYDIQSSSQIIITKIPTPSFITSQTPSCRPANSDKADYVQRI